MDDLGCSWDWRRRGPGFARVVAGPAYLPMQKAATVDWPVLMFTLGRRSLYRLAGLAVAGLQGPGMPRPRRQGARGTGDSGSGAIARVGHRGRPHGAQPGRTAGGGPGLSSGRSHRRIRDAAFQRLRHARRASALRQGAGGSAGAHSRRGGGRSGVASALQQCQDRRGHRRGGRPAAPARRETDCLPTRRRPRLSRRDWSAPPARPPLRRQRPARTSRGDRQRDHGPAMLAQAGRDREALWRRHRRSLDDGGGRGYDMRQTSLADEPDAGCSFRMRSRPVPWRSRCGPVEIR